MHVLAEPLRELITETFLAVGCSEAEARRIAVNLVEANLTGHDSHGVIRTQMYVILLQWEVQLPDQEVEGLGDQGSLLLVTGLYGMGQTVGPQAVELGIERARA
ncbi:MAG: Ldh family oxidoreductase, partial [Actinomycetia bacterium]|nr:Ldh family oxidoreductase [Actinomycetes bacterium]